MTSYTNEKSVRDSKKKSKNLINNQGEKEEINYNATSNNANLRNVVVFTGRAL